jgi:hypothetical protein
MQRIILEFILKSMLFLIAWVFCVMTLDLLYHYHLNPFENLILSLVLSIMLNQFEILESKD